MKKAGAILFLACAPALAAFPVWTIAPMSRAQESALIQAVTHDLRDPDSAKFRGIVRKVSNTGEEAYCGEVNAKNAYGGYTGFVQFYYNASITSGPLSRADDEVMAPMVHALCQ